jgi:hypothetical protein
MKDLLTKEEEIGSVLQDSAFLTGACEFSFVLLVEVRWKLCGSVSGLLQSLAAFPQFTVLSVPHMATFLLFTL